MYSIETICSVIKGKFISHSSNDDIAHLVYDTRRVVIGPGSLFFAIKTDHNDGHKYLDRAWRSGIRNFIVNREIEVDLLPDSNVILVPDVITSLQQLATFHRMQFSIPILGIAGSNGKTIVKEWLFQLLKHDFRIVRSPKSFNSQIGVPLSVWQLNNADELAIFEAGISRPGEMQALEKIIRPTIGIFTNIGDAHSEGFSSVSEKTKEKLLLFQKADLLIYCSETLEGFLKQTGRSMIKCEKFDWSFKNPQATLFIRTMEITGRFTLLTGVFRMNRFSVKLPFTDPASIENAIHCWCVMIYLNYEEKFIAEKFLKLHKVEMRLQLMHGINHCLIINDSYSADLASLELALQFLKQQSAGLKKTVIISDFLDTGKDQKKLNNEILGLLKTYEVSRIIIISEKFQLAWKDIIKPEEPLSLEFFPNTSTFIQQFKSSSFHDEIILIKGARVFEFERIIQLFERKLHQTVLEINLNALVHNLKQYQALLLPGTGIMAMVKALAYGSGSSQIANVLQFQNINYLAVAYADEGVELVKMGIIIPVMVMNTDDASFQSIVNYNLEPVIYSFQMFENFKNYIMELGLSDFPVHIEIDTGMNRLGFDPSEINTLAEMLSLQKYLRFQSVFTHLVASEDSGQDSFSRMQYEIFEKAVKTIQSHIHYPFLKHISNSAAIIRHPQFQMDMVRLGIGLYGIEIDGENMLQLENVATLKSTIAQLRMVRKGESVSYNRSGIVDHDAVIATVRIGYADGYSRQFSKGKGKMWVHGKLAPVVGNVCMDMTMIDVTDINGIREGDEVIIFGRELFIQKVAGWIGTIPYELMTGISQRVKRVYFND